MSDTWDDEDRAIARALDAGADQQDVDEDLVDGYRDVLSEMPIPTVTPPPGLEDRIVSAALARRPAAVPTLDSARSRRRLRVRVITLVAATVAAAVVVGVIVSNASSGPSNTSGHIALAGAQRGDIEALLQAPGTRTAPFSGGHGRVALGRDGNSAIYGLTDPGPVGIGLESRGGTTLLGPVSPRAGAIAFVVDHPERVTAVQLLRNGAVIARAVLPAN